ncbi:MAG: SDR family oxidoreductase, partial [Alphaproteobacteria bacterium]|nr:SDR family oxidoreductase [Alphaproteobacteria bacterium]
RATAAAPASAETALVLHARANRAGLARVAEAARAAGAEVETVLGDLTETGTAADLVARARARFGRLDALVSNAGKSLRKPIGEVTGAELDQAFKLAAGAFLGLTTAALPLLEKSSASRIVAVSSFVAHTQRAALGPFPATAAARAGLEALVKALAHQVAPKGILVNAVAPGFVVKDPDNPSKLTPEQIARLEAEIPLGRRARPEEIARPIAWLASADNSYMTGQVLRIDGGLE